MMMDDAHDNDGDDDGYILNSPTAQCSLSVAQGWATGTSDADDASQLEE